MNGAQQQLLDNLYKLLTEFDRICRKYSIEYFLHCGTLLGAVREKDFIPWDDDIDIIMRHTELERFNEVVHDELPEGFVWTFPCEGEHFLTFHASLQDHNSPYDADFGNRFVFSMFPSLDIYSMEKTSDFFLAREWHFVQLSACYGLGLAHRPTKKFLYPNSYNWFQFIVAKALRLIGRSTTLKGVYNKWLKCASKYREREHTDYVIISSEVPTRHKESFFRSRIFDEIVELPIRDKTFPCPAGYDEMLTRLYGDWRTPPPKDEQINKHLPQAPTQSVGE